MSTTPEEIAAGFTAESVINEMLDLDDLLASEVRRAEKLFPLYTKPHLEAEIDVLQVELESVTDGSAAVPADDEAAVGDDTPHDGRSAEVIAREIQAKRQEYAASRRMIRLRQLTSEDWLAFEQDWKKTLDKGAPYPPEMWDAVIAASAVAPEMPVDKVRALRKKLGNPPLYELAMEAWKLNTEGGISVPFSRLSSHVLRPKPHAGS
ncbi:hypothetical protein [Nocardioides sp. LML1-1-1.1]|uniref:hypothetical protein n=1 Tax=Nocardioides sp. LML1-1-1.1 TaxID=3135248 RepID=UPI0034258F44